MDYPQTERPQTADITETSAVSVSGDRKPAAPKASMLENVYETIGNLGVALIAVALLFSFVMRMVVVDGSSMNDTLQHGDRLILRTLAYTPERGDIVVIYQEDEPTEPLIKRVIAVAGDTVRLDPEADTVELKKAGETAFSVLDESAYVNYPLEWGILWETDDGNGQNNEAVIPQGYVFVLGDHRNNSSDSRMLGLFPVQDIVGEAVFCVTPFSRFGPVG